MGGGSSTVLCNANVELSQSRSRYRSDTLMDGESRKWRDFPTLKEAFVQKSLIINMEGTKLNSGQVELLCLLDDVE